MFKAMLTLILSIGIVQAAELVGRDFPYYIFQDDGALRYCMQPDGPDVKTTSCWTGGVETVCKILPIESGYIDCRNEGEDS